jgi:hypothetical protein
VLNTDSTPLLVLGNIPTIGMKAGISENGLITGRKIMDYTPMVEIME